MGVFDMDVGVTAVYTLVTEIDPAALVATIRIALASDVSREIFRSVSKTGFNFQA